MSKWKKHSRQWWQPMALCGCPYSLDTVRNPMILSSFVKWRQRVVSGRWLGVMWNCVEILVLSFTGSITWGKKTTKELSFNSESNLNAYLSKSLLGLNETFCIRSLASCLAHDECHLSFLAVPCNVISSTGLFPTLLLSFIHDAGHMPSPPLLSSLVSSITLPHCCNHPLLKQIKI